VSTGTCAVVANQYFAPGGTWRTRVARVGNCAPQPLVTVPNLTGDIPAQAASELSAVGLFLAGTVGVTDNFCNNLGTVLNQNPSPGTQVNPGTGVTIFIGQPPPPPAACP
jgi:beta-lactam-binding protein with PASTA domain